MYDLDPKAWHKPISDWKDIFVIESNKIDPQPGFTGDSKDCQMFKNHMNALEFATAIEFELKDSTALDIHRFLTKGIPFFEMNGMSGKYRENGVWVGGHECPKFHLIPHLMSSWYSCTKKWIETSLDYQTCLRAAWASHNMFEVIHPFIDGNGRTGRLLFNKVMVEMGYDPVIFYYEDVQSYYECIQNFRDLFWTGSNFDFTHLNLP